MYRSVSLPSCSFNHVAGFDRRALLAPARNEVQRFERGMDNPAAQFQIAIAKGDVAYLEHTGSIGCMNDADADFAKLHLEDTLGMAKRVPKELAELVPQLGPPPPDWDRPKQLRAAEFRARVRELMETVHLRCSVTTRTPNEKLTALAMNAVKKFRDELEGTAYAIHFDIAETDVGYVQANSVVECGDPDLRSAAYWKRWTWRTAQRRIAAARAVMRRN